MGGGFAKLSKQEHGEFISFGNAQLCNFHGIKNSKSIDKPTQLQSFDEFKQLFNIGFDDWDENDILNIYTLFNSSNSYYGPIDVKESSAAVYLLTKSNINDKLEFLFDLYDCENLNSLSIDNVNKLIQICLSTASRFGYQDNGFNQYVSDNLFKKIIVNDKITKSNFINICCQDEKVLDLFTYF
ncbi:hypothetical protein CYY_003640 [Polysphondylium violaceum]|uniref:Uncharacterized protein n=1 Tax=Polysphondylium violaceum TaxID=133409 RepID=A0A8J4V0Z6_9MYCE|nr:hypothetical protein CYY_003640 [Polysphondylium violaceum]